MTAPNTNTRKIRNASLILGWFSQALLLTLPVLIGIYWATAGEETLGIQWLGRSDVVRGLTSWHRLAGGILMLLMAVPILWGIFRLWQLFRLFATGQLFVRSSVQTLRALAWALISFEVASILVQPLLAMVLTASNPVGERYIAIGVSSGSVMALVIGGVLRVLAWVMDEARKLEEDLAGTV